MFFNLFHHEDLDINLNLHILTSLSGSSTHLITLLLWHLDINLNLYLLDTDLFVWILEVEKDPPGNLVLPV